MKARIEGGKIVKYNAVPNILSNSNKSITNANSASDEVLQEFGFYNIVVPEYDPSTQSINNLHFNAENNYFTYHVVEQVDQQQQEV